MDNPIVKNVTKWIKALRSGRYKQGKDKLFDPSTKTYCCLGVGAKVLRKNPLEVRPMPDDELVPDELLNYETCSQLGINDEMQNQLARKNDMGESFKQIADFIEINVLTPLKKSLSRS